MNKIAVFLVLSLGAGIACATTVLSTTSDARTGGLSFMPGDLVALEPGRIELAGASTFDGSENIDAAAFYGGGWILSTSTDSSIGGAPYLDGDLILWQPATKTASLWLSESVFGADEDIDALEIAPDGRILLSTTSDAALGGLSFKSGDIISYDRASGTASLWFRGADWFDATENIDALALLPDGSALMSTATDGSIGGWTFRDGDIIRFAGSLFSLWLSEGIFAGDEDVDALAAVASTLPATTMPEPGTVGLLFTGLALLGWLKRLIA